VLCRYSTSKLRDTHIYELVNIFIAERLVLVEHPVRNDFHLTDDTSKPAETASDVYRFEVKAPAGKTVTQAVTEERVLSEQVQLTNSNDDQMRFFINATVVSPKVKTGLTQAIDLRGTLNKTQREIAELQRQLQTITDDQVRLRANLKEMPPTAAAYKRYLDKFDQQETQIEKYQADIKTMQGTEHEQKKAFDDFLLSFTAE
jgi:DNA repair exonuclease SbcCD ATPase subunit